jgi:hypothetical protein
LFFEDGNDLVEVLVPSAAAPAGKPLANLSITTSAVFQEA